MDLYRVLKIRKGASARQIKKAYRERAMETHPDRGGNQEEFDQVQQAWEVLSDLAKKERYDATGEYDLHANNELAHMIVVITGAFSYAVKHIHERNAEPENVDLLKLTQEHLEVMRKETSKRITQLKAGEDILKRTVDRFETAEGSMDNPINDITKEQLRQVQAAIEQQGRQLEIEKKSQDYLMQFRYRHQKALEDKNQIKTQQGGFVFKINTASSNFFGP